MALPTPVEQHENPFLRALVEEAGLPLDCVRSGSVVLQAEPVTDPKTGETNTVWTLTADVRATVDGETVARLVAEHQPNLVLG